MPSPVLSRSRKRMLVTSAAATSAAALAVGLAAPAMARDTDHVLWYVENDKNYTFEFDYTSNMKFPDKTDDERDGDSCSVGQNEQGSVAPGEHKYLCWNDIGWSVFDATSQAWQRNTIRNPYAVTDVGRYPLGEQVTADQRAGWSPAFGMTDPENPSWVNVQFKNSGSNTDQVWTLTWEAPVEQEAQLMSLMDVTPDDCTITGTPGDDVLTGTDDDDVICGMGGDDTIYAGDGDDTVKGGSGDDTIYGGDGDDVLGGGSGDDRVDGGSGDDAMHGATGEDMLVGGDGDDLTDGGSGDDALLPDDGDAAEQSSDVNDLAATDSTGNIVEDGNGDGMTAQSLGMTPEEERAYLDWVKNCTFGPYGNC